MTPLLQVQDFFDDTTNTYSYLIWDTATKDAAVIDPVLNFNYSDGHVTTTGADAILASATALDLHILWILETHVHADHLTAANYLRGLTGARIGIGEHVREVWDIFNPLFNYTDADTEHSFDLLLQDHQKLPLGQLDIEVLHMPGHTPACVTYYIDHKMFVGDTIFMPDYGTARADFPGGNATILYRSIKRLLALPDETVLFMCHDYKAPGRDSYSNQTTVQAERLHNKHIHEGVTEEVFVSMRQARDATLSAPTLILPAIQVNLKAGRLPTAAPNGQRYLQIPLTLINPQLAET